jgi:methionyl-tRNA formyltransferase
MKIIFAGTPHFAATALHAIFAAGHEITAVLTQPDRPAGRGMRLQESPVKAFAREKKIPVFQPSSLNRNALDINKQKEAQLILSQIDQMNFDIVVVVAYGLILSQEFLQIAKRNGRHGCFNIHASLLPRWRGAAPIQRAIEAGDSKTGVAIMEMDASLDTGPILMKEEVAITKDETSQSLHDRLASLGAQLIVQALKSIVNNPTIELHAQDVTGISYANKILKSEATLDWNQSAQSLDRKIRAFNPAPGMSTEFENERIKIWRTCLPISRASVPKERPGTILGEGSEGVLVQCSDQPLEVLELQKAGGKKMSAHAWFFANPAIKGLRFSNAPHPIDGKEHAAPPHTKSA